MSSTHATSCCQAQYILSFADRQHGELVRNEVRGGLLRAASGRLVSSPQQHANNLLIADVHSKQGVAGQHLKSDHTQAPHIAGLIGSQLSSLQQRR